MTVNLDETVDSIPLEPLDVKEGESESYPFSKAEDNLFGFLLCLLAQVRIAVFKNSFMERRALNEFLSAYDPLGESNNINTFNRIFADYDISRAIDNKKEFLGLCTSIVGQRVVDLMIKYVFKELDKSNLAFQDVRRRLDIKDSIYRKLQDSYRRVSQNFGRNYTREEFHGISITIEISTSDGRQVRTAAVFPKSTLEAYQKDAITYILANSAESAILQSLEKAGEIDPLYEGLVSTEISKNPIYQPSGYGAYDRVRYYDGTPTERDLELMKGLANEGRGTQRE